MENSPISSQRILLRSIHETDLEAIYSYRSLEEVARYQYWEPFTKEQTADFIDKNKDSDLDKEGEWIGLAVINKQDNKLIGDCAVCVAECKAEIGFNISPDYQHKGFAKEVLNLLCDYYFNISGINEVFGITDSENTASIRLMESIGMVKSSDFEERLICKGVWSIEYKYVITKSDWK
ncbi:RimJ/RimL family protein N-acetyltransferase [Dysgonomonas alginatilytica]|uniref:RimJ/RimL family protein N-acetyltransferase n=1 Tax=Dysgonomonas alginatilytica TaxID=1605892 RepID=A0A2V3PUL0_9BACT|nr:GNAT family protein [Dysgonomonas alginatilytica]PXV68076.1 RimJ/RimL family protein N-acetyltransferase [Dysgonomonas alginatilytica]